MIFFIYIMEKITNIIYDEERRVLEVEVLNKNLFLFTRIKKYLFDEFLNSQSKDEFFNEHIMAGCRGVQIR